ncbi:HNH endonuclease, partial [bacterium]
MKINRQDVYDKFQRRCAYCGKEISIKEMQVDHIHPRMLAHHLRGTGKDVNDYENLNPSCRACNLWKRTYSIEEFRHEIEAQVERLRKYSGGFRLAERYNLLLPTDNA